jgi:hypothetical protein
MRVFWYLNFVKNNEFIGGCVVEAWTMEKAITQSWKLKINPGGDIIGLPVWAEFENLLPHNQFLNVEEIKKYGPTYTYKELMMLASNEMDKPNGGCLFRVGGDYLDLEREAAWRQA